MSKIFKKNFTCLIILLFFVFSVNYYANSETEQQINVIDSGFCKNTYTMDNKISAITNGDIIGYMKFENLSNTSKNLKVIMALYKNGVLMQVVMKDSVLEANVTKTIDFNGSPLKINLLETENISNYSIKMMAWDGANKIQPISQPVLLNNYINNCYLPIKDSYVWNGNNSNVNYGQASSLLVRNTDPSSGYTRVAFMSFEFGDFNADLVQNACINFYVSSVQNPYQIMIYGIADDNWEETSITWNKAPSDTDDAVIVGSMRVNKIGWYSLDVSEFINLQLSTQDKKATFKFTTTLDSGPYEMSSKESVNKPNLQLMSDGSGIKARSAWEFTNSIGVNTHLFWEGTVYDNSFNTIKQRIIELGIRNIRDGISSVNNTEVYKNKVWQRMKDLSTLNDGLKFMLTTYLSTSDDLNRLTTEYQGSGNTWAAISGLNEPDYTMSGDSEWATKTQQHQMAIWNWVQQNNPSLSVVGPVPGNWRNNYYIDNLSNYLTYGDIHSYSWGNSPPTLNKTGGVTGLFAQSVVASKDVRGTKPFVVTETGWHNATDISQSSPMKSTDLNIAAKHLTRTLFYYWNMGAEKTFIYELIDEGVSTSDMEMRFGLLNKDGSTKPTFVAMKNILSVLKDTNKSFNTENLNFLFDGDTQYVRYSLLQKNNGNFYLALWLEQPDDTTNGINKNITITFNNNYISKISSCRVKDTDCLSTLVENVQKGTPVNLELYDDVVILEIKK